MRRVVILVITALTVLSPPSAMASQICDDLWFTRNAVIDQAGYCFGSTLGQTQFDNSDCLGQQITLEPAQADFVAKIQSLESAYACSVDTNRTTLDMPDLALRKSLLVQPMPYEEMQGWGCLGYLGQPVTLHAAPDPGAPQVGRLEIGDWVSVGGHEPVGNWGYVSTHGMSWEGFRSGGWMPLETSMECHTEAG